MRETSVRQDRLSIILPRATRTRARAASACPSVREDGGGIVRGVFHPLGRTVSTFPDGRFQCSTSRSSVDRDKVAVEIADEMNGRDLIGRPREI